MATFKEIETDDAHEGPRDGEQLPPGVVRALVAFLGVVAAAAFTYALPGDLCLTVGSLELCVDQVRPWMPSDPPPFSKLFSTDGVGPQTAEASGGATSTGELSEAEKEILEATQDLDESSEEPVEGPKIVVKPPEPAEDAGATGPGDADAGSAQADAGPAAPPADPFSRIVIPASEYEGFQAEIVDPEGAMDPFFESLANTALQRDGAITRISHWGDSTIAADGMTSMARRLLQRQFGDAGHGFVMVEPGTDWYHQKGVKYERKSWRSRKIIQGQAKDGRYGLGGSSALGYQGAWATYETVDEGPVGRKVGRFDVYYYAGPRRGRLGLYVDGGEGKELSTEAPESQDLVHSVKVPDGPHGLKIRVTGGGAVTVYGVSLEREVPGVIYDGLGIVGARASRLLHYDPKHLAGQLAAAKPNLMIIHFGGNELVDEGMSMTWYEERFTKVVRLFREARPEAACLVMTPIDHGEKYRGRIRTKPDLLKMMPVQKKVALAEGCAFFSIFDAMGGEGSMGRWYRSKPRLGWADLAHTTKAGSRVLGTLFYRSLMKAFADWIAAR